MITMDVVTLTRTFMTTTVGTLFRKPNPILNKLNSFQVLVYVQVRNDKICLYICRLTH